MSQTDVSLAGTDEHFEASMQVDAGVAVVTVSGRLEPSALPTLRGVLDSILRIRAPEIVLDLSRSQLDDESIALVLWMQRHVAHFGVTLTLIGVNHTVLRMLRRHRLDSLIRLRPTDPAQRRALARAEHRDQWTVPDHPTTLRPASPTGQSRARASSDRPGSPRPEEVTDGTHLVASARA